MTQPKEPKEAPTNFGFTKTLLQKLLDTGIYNQIFLYPHLFFDDKPDHSHIAYLVDMHCLTWLVLNMSKLRHGHCCYFLNAIRSFEKEHLV